MSASGILRILVIGKDARTDAIAAACLASETPVELYGMAEMRSPGLKQKCRRLFTEKNLTDTGPLERIIQEVEPDLAIIGPEEPLEAGFVDFFEKRGVAVFGPSKDLAQIETSKSWARELLAKHGIPGNPRYRVFEDETGLGEYMEELGDFVIKPDGLTAGKGVKVFGDHFHSVDEGMAYAVSVLETHPRLQIEERLEGEEFSLQTITDGATKRHLPLVQDHKRAFVGDEGPNTGGMGSYSCSDHSLPFLNVDDRAQAEAINDQVIDALWREVGKPYRGVLYGGFIAVADGVRLIEYNARFGDPEALNVLPLLKGDFVEICSAAAAGTLKDVEVEFDRKATVCKYLVPKAYPERSEDGATIEIPAEAQDQADRKWFWAACEQKGDEIRLTSSRSGAFVGLGDSLAEAEEIADRAAQATVEHLKGAVRYRSDIGRPEIIEARCRHMDAVRDRLAEPVAAARSAA
jgi:phosphoribosylamine---glycine ligase